MKVKRKACCIIFISSSSFSPPTSLLIQPSFCPANPSKIIKKMVSVQKTKLCEINCNQQEFGYYQTHSVFFECCTYTNSTHLHNYSPFFGQFRKKSTLCFFKKIQNVRYIFLVKHKYKTESNLIIFPAHKTMSRYLSHIFKMYYLVCSS